jgi:hypothetical protein
MKKSILILAILMANLSFAQNLNQYKYALVPSKFSFLKENDQYHLNTLAKVYMKQYGFEAYFDTDNQPDDFVNMNCNKVFLDVISNGGMFTTKLTVVLKDCKSNILYTSKEGSSREKEYAVAYNQALRMAFESMQSLNYKYEPTQKSLGIVGEPAIVHEIKPKSEITNQMFFKQYSVIAINNGFNLVGFDSEVFQISRTSEKDIFIAKRNTIAGVLLKKTDNWFFEYYDNDVLKSELIKVKF